MIDNYLEAVRGPADYTILLADDDPDQVKLFKRAMQKAGLCVALQIARCGNEAIGLLKAQTIRGEPPACSSPVLLLLDVNLPQTDGFGVLEWVRLQPEWAGLLVVVWSDAGNNDDVERAYGLGADIFLAKPAGFDGLVELVTALHGWSVVWNRVVQFRNPTVENNGGWNRQRTPVHFQIHEE